DAAGPDRRGPRGGRPARRPAAGLLRDGDGPAAGDRQHRARGPGEVGRDALGQEGLAMFGDVRLIDLSVPLEHQAASEPLPAQIRYARHEGEGLRQMQQSLGVRPEDLVYSGGLGWAVALGRNNWGVIGREAGGRTAAVRYTLVGTCQHLGIDP